MRYIFLFVLASGMSIQFCFAEIYADLLDAVRNNNVLELKRIYPPSRFTPADLEGWTPMHEAARLNHVEAARALYEMGAPISREDGNGWTPLFVAQYKKHGEMMNFLLSVGAR